MITYDGEVKIIDFGVARAELGDYKTRPGQLLGSLRYLAPEQAMGMPVDRRSDLYTLGVIAYELLTLRAYVKNDHPLRVLRAIVQAPSRPDSDFEGVPAGVRAVVRRALSKRSEERFPSAEAMLDALRAELGEIVPAPAGDVSAYLRMLLPRAGEEERTVVAREEAESSPAFEPTRSTLRSLARDTLVRVVVHPARSLVPVAAVAVAIAAGLVAFTLTRAAPVEAPAAAPVQPATPLAKARKVEEPSKEPEGPPPVPKITEPPSRKPRAQKAPDQPPEPRYAALRKTVEALRDDPRRFEAAYDAIRAAAESAALPEATRASILATLNAARLAGDPAGLMRAIDELEE
jgi:serine/threonine-protein kinase